MDVAFLFNADHPDLGGWSLPDVMGRLIGGPLRDADRHVKVSAGDVQTFSHVSRLRGTRGDLRALCERLYRGHGVDLLMHDRLDPLFDTATVEAWVLQNVTADLASAMHADLEPWPPYAGAMGLNLRNGLHVGFLRLLPERYRLTGRHAAIFFDMGDEEDRDVAIQEIFESAGYTVAYEDTGARHTIFDDYYDDPAHIERVADVHDFLAGPAALSDAEVGDLLMGLDELHPRLFDALAAAASAATHASTSEHAAQAGLSGRRFLEQLADHLYPAAAQPVGGRDVGPTKHKNRLWAYVANATADTDDLQRLGQRVDALSAQFNSALHSHRTIAEVVAAYRELVLVVCEIVGLDPAAARRPYLAYEDRLREVLLDSLGPLDP